MAGLARQRAVLTIAAAVGLAFALYLAHIERDVIGVWCLYCVISLAIIALITLLGPVWLIIAANQRRQQALVNLNSAHVQGKIRALDVRLGNPAHHA